MIAPPIEIQLIFLLIFGFSKYFLCSHFSSQLELLGDTKPCHHLLINQETHIKFMCSRSERRMQSVSSFEGRVMSWLTNRRRTLTGGRISQREQVIETPTPLLYPKQLIIPREEVTLLTFYVSLLNPSVRIHM